MAELQRGPPGPGLSRPFECSCSSSSPPQSFHVKHDNTSRRHSLSSALWQLPSAPLIHLQLPILSLLSGTVPFRARMPQLRSRVSHLPVLSIPAPMADFRKTLRRANNGKTLPTVVVRVNISRPDLHYPYVCSAPKVTVDRFQVACGPISRGMTASPPSHYYHQARRGPRPVHTESLGHQAWFGFLK